MGENFFPKISFNVALNNNVKGGTSLVVQWLRLCTPNAGVMGSIPGQGTKTQCSQINK